MPVDPGDGDLGRSESGIRGFSLGPLGKRGLSVETIVIGFWGGRTMRTRNAFLAGRGSWKFGDRNPLEKNSDSAPDLTACARRGSWSGRGLAGARIGISEDPVG